MDHTPKITVLDRIYAKLIHSNVSLTSFDTTGKEESKITKVLFKTALSTVNTRTSHSIAKKSVKPAEKFMKNTLRESRIS